MNTHKALLPLLVGLAVLLSAPAANCQYISRPGGRQSESQGAGSGASGLGLAFVTAMNAESLVKSTDVEEWSALTPKLSLRVGDRVWTQDGANVEIRFPLGATAWVNYQSELDITRLESGSRETIQLALVSGEAAFDVKRFARAGSVFQVDLPSASIRVSRAARFRVNTLPDGTAQVGVISGSIVLETPDGLTDVSGGQMAEVQPDRSVVMDFLPPNDEWDTWVRSRAAIYDRPAASQRYLPADLSSYAHEFDTAGRWQSVGRYGSVWVPAVEQGWSPYSNGRWVWQVNDYVWLSFDPWYAPFHYGRWNWVAAVGWFWIAPRGRSYWSPGYVGWSVSNDEVSWVPLGHNETYYGYGNYGPGNVNITNIVTINITNVYINSRVNNGIVIVKRDNFLRGRIAHERIVSPKNRFLKGDAGDSIIIGRPPVREIKPIPATRMPQPATDSGRAIQPPPRLDREAQTIKNRVVAPTVDRSAFKPGSKPQPLKNIQKEKNVQSRPPAVQIRKDQPDGQTQEARPPGKRQFKRVPEPSGGAGTAPAPSVETPERQKDKKDKAPADDDSRKRNGRQGGTDK